MAVFTTGQPLLDDDFVPDTPQRIEDRLEMVAAVATNDADSHSRTPLFDDNRHPEVLDSIRGKPLRINACKTSRNRNPGPRQGRRGRPVIPAETYRLRRIGGRGPASHEAFEGRQHAFRTPVADPGDDRVRVAGAGPETEQRQSVVSHLGRDGRRVDQIAAGAQPSGGLDESGVCSQIGAGGQEEDTHPPILA